jgi:hypothetical protein
MLTLMPDLILGVLLAATSAWCALVHHRLRRLRTERGEMEAFVASLTAASERAEAAIAGLREAAAEVERAQREQGDAARQRGTELARIIESGSRLARRLETDLNHGVRTLAAASLQREASPRPIAASDPQAREPRPGPATRPGRAPEEAAVPDELRRVLETLR